MSSTRVHVIDSHTAGEPTRVVIAGGPYLGTGPLSERVKIFSQQHDIFRRAVVNEPRGSDVLVGALLLEPCDAASAAGVIYFNNVGVLGMCGHGTIGLIATLAYLNRIQPGLHTIETPVGKVSAELRADGSVQIENIASYRMRAGVSVEVPGYGTVTGDIAWGGNWFFLVAKHHLQLIAEEIPNLTRFSLAIQSALARQNIVGENNKEIDHIELFGPSPTPGAHSRNFVLCPGGAYDRSPCGTGTSAKLACLYADGKLVPGDVWRQESIIGSIFEGSVRLDGGKIIPRIVGRAFVNADSQLIFDQADPYCMGIPQ